MTNRVRLQYYCEDCNNILREVDSDLGISKVAEPCPFCGSLLSESLQMRNMLPRIAGPSVFQPASLIPRLVMDIGNLDSAIPFLSINQKVAVVGRHSQKIVERLAVRAQLSHRHGGLGSRVAIVDGGNSSDPYLCIDFARQYGLDATLVLSRIISSRAFTVYQLENLVSRELPGVIKKYDAKIVILSDILAMFSDPNIDVAEAEHLIGSISGSVSRLRECLVVVSLSNPTRYDGILLKPFDRVLYLSERGSIITVGLGGKDYAIKESDLEVVSRR